MPAIKLSDSEQKLIGMTHTREKTCLRYLRAAGVTLLLKRSMLSKGYQKKYQQIETGKHIMTLNSVQARSC